ncbi:MAG: hypothetical protein HKN85_03550 [Gammaproteobacteria bacterium]|nr:hypothetical protein [Gammaproteobacteria bacterium]
MTNSEIRHCAFAYLLTLTLALAVWLAAVAPLKSRWDQHKLRTSSLQAKVKLAEEQALAAKHSSQNLHHTLQSLVAAGSLIKVALPGEAGHLLQGQAKQALQSASATILQLRPSTYRHSPWLMQSRLEISFRIVPNQIETLLASLSDRTSVLHVETISLRRSMSAGNAGQFPILEATLTLALWHMSKSLMELAGNITGPATDPDQSSLPKETRPSSWSARLAGLFDAAYRARLSNLSREHYRLSAITMSSDARIAVIADVETGTTRRLREGDMLDAWKIGEINAAEVTLVHGERREKLLLQRK